MSMPAPLVAIWGEWWKGDGGVTDPSTFAPDGAAARRGPGDDISGRSRGAASRSIGASSCTLSTVGDMFSRSPPYGFGVDPTFW